MATRADEIRAELIRRELASRGLAPPPPIVRQAGAVRDLQEKWKGISDNPLMAAGQLVAGGLDLAGGGIAGLAEKTEGLVRGIGGALNPNDTYMAARQRTPPAVRDPAPVTAGGKVISSALGAVLSGTKLPEIASAVAQGSNSLLGPAVTDALGTGIELATLAVPLGRARSATPLAQVAENAERLGYLTPAYARIGRAGQTAGGAVERAVEGAGGLDTSDAIKAVYNQNVTDRLVARAGRLDTEYPTTASIKSAVARAEAPYEQVRQTGLKFVSDRDYMRAVSDMSGSQHAGAGVRLPVDAAVEKLQAAMRNTRVHSAGSLIDQIGVLRSQGFRALSSLDDAAALRGAAQLKGADALEALLERGLNRAAARTQGANPAAAALLRKLIDDYKAGRAARSDLHVIEESLVPGGTGVVDMARLARVAERRGGLNNPLLDRVAQVGQNFKEVTTPLPVAARRSVRTGLGTMSRNESGAIGATVGRLLARTAFRMSQSRRAGGAAANARGAARAGAVGAGRALTLEELTQEEPE